MLKVCLVLSSDLTFNPFLQCRMAWNTLARKVGHSWTAFVRTLARAVSLYCGAQSRRRSILRKEDGYLARLSRVKPRSCAKLLFLGGSFGPDIWTRGSVRCQNAGAHLAMRLTRNLANDRPRHGRCHASADQVRVLWECLPTRGTYATIMTLKYS